MESSLKDSVRSHRNRIFRGTRGWFFATREGVDMGPFPDKPSAELEMIGYIKTMKSSRSQEEFSLNVR